MRLIAETDQGRLIIKEFSKFGTNASFAETKQRFVPDWYIHPNGPISSLTTGNHSYSEYYYLPLNSEERWKRYVGTLPPSVPLFVSLFQQTSNVLARIVGAPSSVGSDGSGGSSGGTGSGGSSGSGSGSSSATSSASSSTSSKSLSSIDGCLTTHAREISSPLRTKAAEVPKLPTEADIEAAKIFEQTSIGELFTVGDPLDPGPLAPQSESEILTTEEVISKKDLPDIEGPLDTTEYSTPPDSPLNPYGDSPPTYSDHKKDVLVQYNPDEIEEVPAYKEIATGEIGTSLTQPYNVKEFMKNVLTIRYIKLRVKFIS